MREAPLDPPADRFADVEVFYYFCECGSEGDTDIDDIDAGTAYGTCLDCGDQVSKQLVF